MALGVERRQLLTCHPHMAATVGRPVSHGSSAALAVHAAALVVLLVVGLVWSSAAALGEAAHQAIDAAAHTAALQHVATSVWHRCLPPETLAFGPARLSTLLRLGATVVAAGGALFVGLDASIELLLPGAHQHAETEPLAAVPWSAAAASAAATLLAATVAGGSESGAYYDDEAPPRRWALLRAGTLLLCAAIGLPSGMDGGAMGGGGAQRGNGRRESSLGAQMVLPGSTPPLLRLVLSLVLRRPDAAAGALLCALALGRGCMEARSPAKLLLQAAPHRALVPDLAGRLARARAVPGVRAVRDVQLWLLDEHTVTGSLTVLAHGHVDPQLVRRHVRREIEGPPLTELTVQLEADDDDLGYSYQPHAAASAAGVAANGSASDSASWHELGCTPVAGTSTARSR